MELLGLSPEGTKVLWSVVAAVLMLVGLAGLPDDIRKWFRVLRHGVPWWLQLSAASGLLVWVWIPGFWPWWIPVPLVLGVTAWKVGKRPRTNWPTISSTLIQPPTANDTKLRELLRAWYYEVGDEASQALVALRGAVAKHGIDTQHTPGHAIQQLGHVAISGEDVRKPTDALPFALSKNEPVSEDLLVAWFNAYHQRQRRILYLVQAIELDVRPLREFKGWVRVHDRLVGRSKQMVAKQLFSENTRGMVLQYLRLDPDWPI